MGFKEIFLYRIPQQLQYNLFGHIQKREKVDSSLISFNPEFDLNSYTKHENFINRIADKDFLKYNFFNVKFDLSQDVKWLLDCKNNISSTKKYYSKIKRQNFKEIGDIKFVNEPSRFHFLPFLALKASICDDDFWLNKINLIIQSWKDQNPFLQSIHWTSGIEVGIRSLNLVYTHLVLKATNKLDATTDKLIKELILYNYKYLKNHLSLYSSANNHLVAELMGLVVISSFYDNKKIKKERNKWAAKLFVQILKQVNEDGVHMELSTHYHAEVTDHFYNALTFLKKSEFSIPLEVEKRVNRMFDFLKHVEYMESKTIYGDNDEGYLIYPYFDSKFSIYKSLLKTFSIENGNMMNGFDWRNYLIFGDSLYISSSQKEQLEIPSDTIFKDSGYAFSYDHESFAKVSFDFGKIGDDISAAHGHSDILHFTFDIKGVPILVDSGTYQYHSKYNDWRKYFRSVKAHNTISVNNYDHAFQASRMSWTKTPNTHLISVKNKKKLFIIEAQTDAYRKYGVLHKRKLVFDKNKKELIIVDCLDSVGTFKNTPIIYFYLNLNADLKWSHEKEILRTSVFKEHEVSIENIEFIKGNLIESSKLDYLGWRSKNYDSKEPGLVFVIKTELNENIEFTTKINY